MPPKRLQELSKRLQESRKYASQTPKSCSHTLILSCTHRLILSCSHGFMLSCSPIVMPSRYRPPRALVKEQLGNASFFPFHVFLVSSALSPSQLSFQSHAKAYAPSVTRFPFLLVQVLKIVLPSRREPCFHTNSLSNFEGVLGWVWGPPGGPQGGPQEVSQETPKDVPGAPEEAPREPKEVPRKPLSALVALFSALSTLFSL